MGLTKRETATILAALRLFQKRRAEGERMPHFEDELPLDDLEIDELCERINTAHEGEG
jgi:hypothetical protein